VRLPILEVLRRYPGGVLLAIGARMAENACFYIFTVFVVSYATDQLKIDKAIVLQGLLIAAAIEFFAIPTLGVLSDRIGRRPVYLAGAFGLAVFAFPFFRLIDTRQTVVIWGALIIAELVHAAMYAPQAAFLSELFGTEVRYSGASIGYQLSAPLSGGIAPLIATALLQWSGGEPWPVALYLIAMATITLISVWLASETHRIKLDET
jgi:MFS family permease